MINLYKSSIFCHPLLSLLLWGSTHVIKNKMGIYIRTHAGRRGTGEGNFLSSPDWDRLNYRRSYLLGSAGLTGELSPHSLSESLASVCSQQTLSDDRKNTYHHQRKELNVLFTQSPFENCSIFFCLFFKQPTYYYILFPRGKKSIFYYCH